MTQIEKLQRLKLRSDELQSESVKLQQDISEAVIEIYKQHIKYEDRVERVRIAPRKFVDKSYKVGYVECVEYFDDKDTGEGFPVTRKHYVWKDDKWYNTDDIEFCLTHLI